MRILYVTTISNTVNAFLIPHIMLLIDMGHQVDVAFHIVQEVSPEIIDLGCHIHNLEFQRSPLSKDNYSAYHKLKRIIQENNYDLVHTHTPIASACVRLACRKLKNIKVIYTAHGFHFYKGAPLLNWLLYYPIEKWLSRYTDILITINNEDYNRAKKSFKAEYIKYIPGVGLDIDKFSNVVIDKFDKRKEIGVPNEAFVILSVGELNKNKNHETIIKAIAMLNSPSVYYVICGQGSFKDYLKDVAKKFNVDKKVVFLGYRKDIAEICKTSDVFAFPSHREGLGLAALEAMANGLPLVTSNVHGIVDYSINNMTGFTSSPEDIQGFSRSFNKLINDSDLRLRMSIHNIESVRKYCITNVLQKIKEIYEIYA